MIQLFARINVIQLEIWDVQLVALDMHQCQRVVTVTLLVIAHMPTIRLQRRSVNVSCISRNNTL